jgi:hypothetical protein
MPDPKVATVARFPDTSATTVRATIDALLSALMNLERAQRDLARERDLKLGEKIDTFATAAAKAVTPADVMKQRVDLETLKMAFDDQAEAVGFWTDRIGERLDWVSTEHAAEVAEAIDARINALKQQEAKEQGDVDQVQAAIEELEERRKALLGGGQARQAAAAAKKK